MRQGSPRLGDERGDIVIGWLTRLLAILAVVAIVLIDAISVVKAHYGAQGDAELAAAAASANFAKTHDVDQAYQAALAVAAPNEESINKKTFLVDKAGSVRLVLTRTATTLVLERVSPLRKFGIATASGTAAPPSGELAAP